MNTLYMVSLYFVPRTPLSGLKASGRDKREAQTNRHIICLAKTYKLSDGRTEEQVACFVWG